MKEIDWKIVYQHYLGTKLSVCIAKKPLRTIVTKHFVYLYPHQRNSYDGETQGMTLNSHHL